MDLAQNWQPRFTEWAVRNGLLPTPFVLADAGVQGGFHPRWNSLGGRLLAHGFDPLAEAIAALGQSPTRRFHCLALGGEDGERDIFLAPDSTATSFYGAAVESDYAVAASTLRTLGARRVTVRRLDSLVAEGAVPRPDFIKIDCEGAEPEILRGAQALLADGVEAVEVETNFNVSPPHPESHFGAVCAELLSRGFLLYDLVFDRVRNKSFADRARRSGIGHPVSRSRPATCNALFCRTAAPRDADALLKRVIALELYGMCDAAFGDLTAHMALLPPSADWRRGVDLLIQGPSIVALARWARASAAYRWKRLTGAKPS